MVNLTKTKLSSTLSPLYRLLKKDTKLMWDISCDRAFDKCKTQLLKADFLVFFYQKKKYCGLCRYFFLWFRESNITRYWWDRKTNMLCFVFTQLSSKNLPDSKSGSTGHSFHNQEISQVFIWPVIHCLIWS